MHVVEEREGTRTKESVSAKKSDEVHMNKYTCNKMMGFARELQRHESKR
jgi:hypothetical protein